MRRLLGFWCFVSFSVLSCLAQLPASEQEQNPKPATDQKIIRDPVEYNAYITALNTEPPAQQAAALEAFVTTYPNSAVLEDALEHEMAAYSGANNSAKVEATAQRVLQLDPDNVRALAIIVALTRNALTRGINTKEIPGLRTFAARGLKALEHWTKPEGETESDFEKQKQQMYMIFYGGEAFAALQEKDFSAAQPGYIKALRIDPDDLANNYQLSIAFLEPENIDVRGFWYVARAVYLAQKNEPAVGGITAYGQSKYRKYHGSLDGWDNLLQRAAQRTTPPPDFSVTRGLESPAEKDKTAASVSSNSSPGNAHRVPASVLSSNRTPAGIVPQTSGSTTGVPASVLSPSSNDAGSRTSASILSSGTPASTRGEPASLMSSASVDGAHEVPASVASSAPPASVESRVHKRLVRFGKPHRPGIPLLPVPIFLPASRKPPLITK